MLTFDVFFHYQLRTYRKLSLFLFSAFALITIHVPGAHALMFLRDAEIEEFLRDYANPILEVAQFEPHAVGIHLVGNNSLNAFVANGQNMFIFTGLIMSADDPNQLEGVIAHEIGHMQGRHLSRSDDAVKAISRPVILSLVLGAAAMAAGAPDAGLAVIGLGQTVGQANYLKYSRGQESAADQAALTLLQDVESSAQGLLDFFAKLRNQQLITGNKINPYLLTHPTANQRISILRDRANLSPFRENVSSPENIHRLRMIQAKISGFMHPPTQVLRRYPLHDTSRPARYARAVAFYRQSLLENALSEINSLLAAEPENPYFYELKGQMLFEHGKVAQSIEPHRHSTALAPQYALLQINLARALIATEDKRLIPESIRILKSALVKEPENVFGWTELARAYGAAGQIALADLATAEASYRGGNLPRAFRFANRALKGLAKGSYEWTQAMDIKNASKKAAKKASRRAPKRKP